MQKGQLKRLIETGAYRPEPGDVAVAMLARRSVRELLTGGAAIANGGGSSSNGNGKLPLNPADRIQSPPAFPRQAA
ncbi:MAG TPA: hypothetical protein VFU04_03940 [Solirubrobacterales bacterium]|nr:hypothetical protein [Solirubrobacterales bacterium]